MVSPERRFPSGNAAGESAGNRWPNNIFIGAPRAAPPGRTPAGYKGKAKLRYRNKHSFSAVFTSGIKHK